MKMIIKKHFFLIILFILVLVFIIELKTVRAAYYEKQSSSLIYGVVGNFDQ